MKDTPTSGGGPFPESGSDVHALRDSYPVAGLSLDAIFDILADQRRRYALHALWHAPLGATDVETVADRVAAWETATGSDVDEARVRADLHHRHLPKLDDVGVVDYDARSGDVRYWGHPVVEEYLDHVAPIEWKE